VVAADLYREAAALNLDVTGPLIWQYVGFDPSPGAEFTLHIALPVAEASGTTRANLPFSAPSHSGACRPYTKGLDGTAPKPTEAV
jgi:hypothetical protein